VSVVTVELSAAYVVPDLTHDTRLARIVHHLNDDQAFFSHSDMAYVFTVLRGLNAVLQLQEIASDRQGRSVTPEIDETTRLSGDIEIHK
jgi:hypothetical protein